MKTPSGGVPAASPATTTSLRVSVVTPLPEQVAVGGGTALFIDGRCGHPDASIVGLDVVFDGERAPATGWGMPLPGRIHGDGYWWAIVSIPSVEESRVAWIELRAELDSGRAASGRLGAVRLVRDLEPPSAEGLAEPGTPGPGSVAICMATHEPPRDLFERQVESIRAQTHRDWVCVISDDASSPEAIEAIREVLDGDGRFRLSRSDSRLGFYRNFERALTMVPPEARFVALSDQDDRWRPDKLRTLIAAMGDGTRLAYSDMRVIGEGGDVISPTYWSFRPNNYEDFTALMLANTVTGAASLFEASLLRYVLPFPPPLGNAYHDHWVAMVAMALGGLSYVDEPLYDYVQHGGSVVGHRRANNADGGLGALARARRLAGEVRLRGFHPGWRAFYFNILCRTEIAARTLELRLGDRMSDRRKQELERARPALANVPSLVRRTLSRGAGSSTLGREGAMLRGMAWLGLGEARRRVQGLRPRTREIPLAVETTADGGLKPLLLDYFTRDGSTLMMRLLASSPQIAVEDVYPFERKYFAYLWSWAHLLERGDWPPERWGPESLASLDELRSSSLLGPPPWQPRPLIDALPGEPELSRRCFDAAWREFSKRAAARTARSKGGDPSAVLYSAEKHLNTWLIPREQLPAHELIVLLRDPRDTWVSINAFGDGSGFGGEHGASRERLLDHVISRQRERLRWILELEDRADVPVVRYDDLVLDLASVAARLSSHLGVDLDPAATLADRTTRKRHVSAASPAASIGRWEHELDPEVAGIFAREIGEEMRELGLRV